MVPLVPIERPNGKLYRPRKIVAAPWDNEACGRYDGAQGVYILGTHDIVASHERALWGVRYWHDGGLVAANPALSWVRDGFLYGDRSWMDDAVRGRAAVCWTAAYPEDMCPDPGCFYLKGHRPVAEKRGPYSDHHAVIGLETTDKEN